MMPDLVTRLDYLTTGIQTEAILEGDRPGFWVTWIDWDSDFRRELQLGDRIIAIDGRDLSSMLQPGQMSPGIGQAGENGYWSSHGGQHGQSVRLTVWRGEARVELAGQLHAEYYYRDAEGRRSLAPGGPAVLVNDGFGEPWMRWYEQLWQKCSYVLTRGWRMRSFNNRMELSDFLEQEERVAYLEQHHPGPFAESVRADWQRVRTCLEGERFELSAADLAYRSLGEQRTQAAQSAAATAWDALRAELAAEMRPTFPAPEVTERRAVAGKVVELPRIGERDLVVDLGRVYYAAGSPSDGYYFIDGEAPEVGRLYDVARRYRARVNPQLADRYRYLGRIQDAPRIITVAGRPQPGLTVQLVAALGGDDELGVDLRPEAPRFAGEEALPPSSASTMDASSPASVVTAMVTAIKLGDDAAFQRLFSSWSIGEGRIDVGFSASPSTLSSNFDRSRQLITSTVYDARVAEVDPVRTVMRRDPAAGTVDVEVVTVWLAHVGRFDGEYRDFVDVNVHREWTLQRMDGGPWQIASVQSL
jgi:hypothetical protein